MDCGLFPPAKSALDYLTVGQPRSPHGLEVWRTGSSRWRVSLSVCCLPQWTWTLWTMCCSGESWQREGEWCRVELKLFVLWTATLLFQRESLRLNDFSQSRVMKRFIFTINIIITSLLPLQQRPSKQQLEKQNKPRRNVHYNIKNMTSSAHAHVKPGFMIGEPACTDEVRVHVVLTYQFIAVCM